MARDPADVLAAHRWGVERAHLVDYTWEAAPVAEREAWTLGIRDLLAALDAAGYEVRPKAEEGVVTVDGKRWRIEPDEFGPSRVTQGRIEPDGSRSTVITTHDWSALLVCLDEPEVVPATDGDDPSSDHRGEPQGAPDP